MAWRVARSLLVLRDQVDALYPGRSKGADGTIGDEAHAASVSDHNPDTAGIVRALDLTHDPGHGLDIDALSDALAACRDGRIKYLIANRLIMSGAAGPSPWAWRAYTGADPHTGHLHLSVVADARADDTTPWRIGGNTPSPAPSPSRGDAMPALVKLETDPTIYLTDGISARTIGSMAELADVQQLHREGTLPLGNGGQVRAVGRASLIGTVTQPATLSDSQVADIAAAVVLILGARAGLTREDVTSAVLAAISQVRLTAAG